MLYSILIYVPEDLVDAMSKRGEGRTHRASTCRCTTSSRAQGRLGPACG